MTRVFKILIVDPDRFFVAGLQQILKKHFHAKGVRAICMSQPLSYPMADLILWAPGYTTTVMPMRLLAHHSHKYRLILLMSQHKTHFATNYVPWVFYRHQRPRSLLTLIEQAIDTSTSNKIEDLNDPQSRCTINALSPREREVIGCIAKSMNLRAISERLHIHEKTVSHHKKSAMRKLQLSRTIDLHHWLLCNHIINNSV
ncbi:TPA: response regulator transcription factor [Raoultella planticola]|nr:response regulator transcription factor [Raoultella planticola]